MLILHLRLCLESDLFPPGFPTESLLHLSCLTCVLQDTLAYGGRIYLSVNMLKHSHLLLLHTLQGCGGFSVAVVVPLEFESTFPVMTLITEKRLDLMIVVCWLDH